MKLQKSMKKTKVKKKVNRQLSKTFHTVSVAPCRILFSLKRSSEVQSKTKFRSFSNRFINC